MAHHIIEREKIYIKRNESFKHLNHNRIKKNHLDAFEEFLKRQGTLSKNSLIIRCKINKQKYDIKIIVDKTISQYRYYNSFLPFLKRILSRVDGSLDFFVLLSDKLYIAPDSILECSELLKRIPFLSCDKSPKDILSQYYLLIPDFYIQDKQYGYELEAINKMVEKYPFHKRSDIIMWRGSLTGPDHPTLQSYTAFPRYKLLEMSLKYPKVLDAKLIGYENLIGNEFAEKLQSQLQNTFGPLCNRLSAEEFVVYKYLISLDGVAAAWKRVPTILASGSVLLLQCEWEQFFYPGLTPYEHYIPIKQDLSDLLEKYEWLKQNFQKSVEIASKGRSFAKEFLSPAFLEQYFVDTLNMCGNLYDY